MQKITITKAERKKHKEYFYQNAIPELEKLIRKFQKENSRKQLKFLRLCLYYKKQLAIGKPSQLRKIQQIIDKKFAGIYGLGSFQSDVEKAFGYGKFSSAGIGEQILKAAKARAGQHSHTGIHPYANGQVLQEIQKQLAACSKEVAKEFEDGVNLLKQQITKEALEGLLSYILITNVMAGSISAVQWPEWNAYLLQYTRKVRTCPYCNRQYITPYYSKTGKVRADLDHFYSKIRYPHFSMSIYNLMPCCKFCNSSLKGTKEFKLDDQTPYEISIDEEASFHYHPGFCPAITFDARDGALPYKEMFKIEELYNYHKNIAEDMHRKFLCYSPLKVKDMIESGLFHSKRELYQLILGKISSQDEILEEPLSKYKRDMVYEIYGEEILELVTQL